MKQPKNKNIKDIKNLIDEIKETKIIGIQPENINELIKKIKKLKTKKKDSKKIIEQKVDNYILINKLLTTEEQKQNEPTLDMFNDEGLLRDTLRFYYSYIGVPIPPLKNLNLNELKEFINNARVPINESWNIHRSDKYKKYTNINLKDFIFFYNFASTKKK